MSGTLAVDVRLERGAFTLAATFEAPLDGVTAVFGPSAAGKTTLLRAIAGLERARGRVRIGESVWQDDAAGRFMPVHRRGIGFVFQDDALLDHLTVSGNLRYAARRAGPGAMPPEEAARLAGVAHLGARPPRALSGGERRRAALARALVAARSLLVLDEPFTGLDAPARAALLEDLAALRGRLAVPMLLVTHQLDEAVRLASHLVYVEAGRVLAAGPLTLLLAQADLPLARREDASAVLEAVVEGWDAEDAVTTVAAGALRLVVAGRHGEPGARLRLRVLARDVSLALDPPGRTSILNVIPATVTDVTAEPAQGRALVGLDCAGQRLLARVTRRSVRRLGLRPGLAVHAQVKAVAVIPP